MKKIFTLLFILASVSVIQSCKNSDAKEYVEVEVPTVGLITTVVEVKKDNFKIEDEKPVDSVKDSRIIAKYMDGKVDTFTLEQAKLISRIDSANNASGNHRSHRGSWYRAASFGFMGYMMGRSMRTPVSPDAYTNTAAYDRVKNTTGNTVRSNTRTVRRPSPKGRSGFGRGRSSRSYGG